MFSAGQKVVCIRDLGPEAVWLFVVSGILLNLPKLNGIYTVRSAVTDSTGTFLRLTEIVNSVEPNFTEEPAFLADAFRPLVNSETDITIFKEIDRDIFTRTKGKEPVSA